MKELFRKVNFKSPAKIIAIFGGLITFAYLFFSNPFIPIIYICDFSTQSNGNPSIIQYDTGYGFNQVQKLAVNPKATDPVLKLYANPIQSIEFDRIQGGIINCSWDSSGLFRKFYPKKLTIKPNYYSPGALVFRINPNSVRNLTISTRDRREVLPLGDSQKRQVYIIIYADHNGLTHFGMSSRISILYAYRYIPTNLHKIRINSDYDTSLPYSLLISGNVCRPVAGSRQGSWNYFSVDLSPFGEPNIYYTGACAAAAFIVMLIILVLCNLRQTCRLVTFTGGADSRAIQPFAWLFVIFSCCYAFLLYVYYPGTSPVDFPYNQTTSLHYSHWLSIYHSLFYTLSYITFGFSGIFITQILVTSYLLALAANSWIGLGLNRKYSTILVLFIGFSPVVIAYSIYFKRDILGALFCALTATLAFIAIRSSRKALPWAYVFAVLACMTRIDYIFYLIALIIIDIVYGSNRLKIAIRSILILVGVILVLHSIVPSLITKEPEKTAARYKVVAFATFLHYAYKNEMLPEEDRKIFLDHYNISDQKFHVNRDLRIEVDDHTSFRNLWIRTATSHPAAFLSFYASQLKEALNTFYFEALPSYKGRLNISLNFDLLQPREGTFAYQVIKSYYSARHLWAILPILIILFATIFTFKRTPITSSFAMAGIVRFFALLPIAPGYRFFYAYDIYLIGLLSLGFFALEWRITATQKNAP